MLAAFENIALWHERDISHSSVERIIFPDSTILLQLICSRRPAVGGQHQLFIPDNMARQLR
jgi:adenylosuccinate lyase